MPAKGGDRRCEAKANEGRLKDQADAKLEILEAPRIDRESLRDEVPRRVGDSVKLGCPMEPGAWPRAKHSWYFNREKLNNITASILSVEHIEAKDYGVYQCEVSNAVGSDIAQIWLKEPGKYWLISEACA